MGCGKSKGAQDENKIPCEINDCWIPEFMEVFTPAGNLLTTAEEIRSGIQDTKEEAFDLIEAWRIKNPTLWDAFKIMVCALIGDAADGNDPLTGIHFTAEPPFINLTVWTKTWDLDNLVKAIQEYIKTVTGGITKIPEIVTNATELGTKAAEFPIKAQDAAKSANLPALQMLKAVKRTAENSNILVKGVQKLPKVKEAIEDAIKDIKAIAEQWGKEKDDIIKLGKMAAERKLYKPYEITRELYPKERLKTPEEIAADQKKAEKEKADREKARQKKKGGAAGAPAGAPAAAGATHSHGHGQAHAH